MTSRLNGAPDPKYCLRCYQATTSVIKKCPHIKMWLWNVKAAHASLHFSTEIRLNIQGMKYVCQKKIVDINFSNSSSSR